MSVVVGSSFLELHVAMMSPAMTTFKTSLTLSSFHKLCGAVKFVRATFNLIDHS